MNTGRFGWAAGALLLLASLALGDMARAQCECYEDGCFRRGEVRVSRRLQLRVLVPVQRRNAGLARLHRGGPDERARGRRMCRGARLPGTPPELRRLRLVRFGAERRARLHPAEHAEEMQRAQELYAAGQQNARPPAIAPYTASAPAAAAPVPAATGTTNVKTIAAKVPPLPKSSQMDYGPMLNPAEPAAKTPALTGI